MSETAQEDILVYLRKDRRTVDVEHPQGGYELGVLVAGSRLKEAADELERLRRLVAGEEGRLREAWRAGEDYGALEVVDGEERAVAAILGRRDYVGGMR